jgi:hypothetical protein
MVLLNKEIVVLLGYYVLPSDQFCTFEFVK